MNVRTTQKCRIGERPKSKFWNEMFLRKTEDVVKNDVSHMWVQLGLPRLNPKIYIFVF